MVRKNIILEIVRICNDKKVNKRIEVFVNFEKRKKKEEWYIRKNCNKNFYLDKKKCFYSITYILCLNNCFFEKKNNIVNEFLKFGLINVI